MESGNKLVNMLCPLMKISLHAKNRHFISHKPVIFNFPPPKPSTNNSELIYFIIDLDLQICFSMEIGGRFPSDTEAVEYEVGKTTPVWLPSRPDCQQFTEDVKSQLAWLREAINE